MGTMLPVLGADSDLVRERVLVVGDPARAERIAERLTDAAVVSRNREYVMVHGTHRDTEVAVVSHGVGSAGAGVCFEELCRGGARRIIRAGTCGGMQPNVRDGALVVAHGAVRDDGLTGHLVPPTFPAVADVDIVIALRAAAAAAGADVHEGIVLTSDVFYPHDVLGGELPMWARAGVIAVEMECSALLIVAALHRVAAGAIFAADGNPLADDDEDMTGYDPHRQVVTDAVDTMITVALDALVAA